MITVVSGKRDTQITDIPPGFRAKDLLQLLSCYLHSDISDSKILKQFMLLNNEDIIEDDTRYLLIDEKISANLRFIESIIINGIDLTFINMISAKSFPLIQGDRFQITIILKQYTDIKDPTNINIYLNDNLILQDKQLDLSKTYTIPTILHGTLTIQIDNICRKFIC